MIEVYPPGTEVELGAPSEPIDGRIESVWIKASNHVIYKVCWWNGRERKSTWVQAFEIRPKNVLAPSRIGFIASDPTPAPGGSLRLSLALLATSYIGHRTTLMATTVGGQAPYEYRTEWGDTIISIDPEHEPNPIIEMKELHHVYHRAGVYTVECTVTDKNGSKATDRISISVSPNVHPLSKERNLHATR